MSTAFSTRSTELVANEQEEANEDSDADSLLGYLVDQEYEQDATQTLESQRIEVQLEATKLARLIEKGEYNGKSTGEFWLKHAIELPHLKTLCLHLSNIPSSSSYIERFFSLCGSICSQRRANMSAEKIVSRAIIKTNMNLILKLNKQ